MDNLGDYEGTVAPSFLGSRNSRGSDLYANAFLRVGRVVRIRPPKKDGNRNGLYTEYDVVVDAGSEHSPSTRFTVYNCLMLSAFGGRADYSTWAPRLTDPAKAGDANDLGDGTQVAVLHINGSTFGGLIIGGVQHSHGRGTKGKGDEEEGFDAVYNGIRATVDAKGQLTLTYGGKTDPSGNTTATATGTRIQLQEDGSLLLATGDDKQSLKLDRAAGEVHVDSTGLLKTSGAGVHLGGAGDAMLMGSTFRQQQAVMHTAMQTAMASLTAAGAALTAASASILAGFTPLDPTTAAPATVAGLAAAGAGITAAAAAMTAALTTFEAPAPTYLSLKNKLD